jgi:hypothetical protein
VQHLPRLLSCSLRGEYPAIASSTIDFVSVHTSTWRGYLTLDQYMQNFGLMGYQQEKPVLMEEFAALGSDFTETEAAALLQAWQAGFCNYGITGSLLWTWDTSSSEQPQYWWAAILGEGSINQALAPVNRPDPCK